MFLISDSARESIKKSISRSGDRKFLPIGFSKRSGIVQIFPRLVVFCLMRFDIYCFYLNFRFSSCSV